MFCKDLSSHILTITIINCLFLLCGAEVDPKLNEVYEDDHDIIRNATKEQLNSSDSYIPTFGPSYSTSKRYYSTDEKVIYIIVAIVVCVIIIAIKCCCKYMKDQEHDVEDAIVHPPPAQRSTVYAPSGPFQPPNLESVILQPNETHPVFVSVYNPNYGRAAYNAENTTIQAGAEHGSTNPVMDLPPSYDSVVNSAKDGHTSYQFPAVSKQKPTAPDQDKY